MTSNNETVSRQMPWAGNSAKTMTSNRKQFTVTGETLTAVARHLSMTRLFVFHRFDPFALLYNKSLNYWSLEGQWIFFPSSLNVSLDFVSGYIEILGKQNALFPRDQSFSVYYNPVISKIAHELRKKGWRVLELIPDKGHISMINFIATFIEFVAFTKKKENSMRN